MEYRPPVCMISLAQIERERLLPVPGQVLVQVGDRVEAVEVVASALRPGATFAINAARDLGVGNAMLPRYMLKKEGDEIQAHEVLAARGGLFGLFRRTCRAPVAGKVASIVQGRILLEREPSPIELRAHFRGEVVRIVPGYGAVIRTTGAVIRGIWGNGKEAHGIIRVVVEEPEQPLTGDLIDASCHGAVVVGGSLVDRSALQQATENSVRGLVAGALEGELMSLVRSLPFPVVITQGLGDLPMAKPMFNLFRLHQGREAAILQPEMPSEMARPEILITLPADQTVSAKESAQAPLTVGTLVHIVSLPYVGLTGQVVSEPALMCDQEMNMHFWGVRVRLDDGREVTVPVTHLDLIQ